MVGEVRISHGRTKSTTFLIIDAQSVKNTSTAKYKGYDAGKKVSGVKRHIAVDSQGLPHALYLTTANISDKAGAVAMLTEHQQSLQGTMNVLVDGGYQGQPFVDKVQAVIGATVEVIKRSELHSFKVMPKRWVVERSFAWLEKCHRLWKNCEYYLNTSKQMAVLAFVALLLKRF